MRIAQLRIENFGPFKGVHVLELGSKVYAIVARLAGDAERSNWLGKTTFLEAITFALYGTHRYRTEDEWLSRGEAHGKVEIVLEGGARILRSRDRGKRTVVHLFPADGTPASIQDEADAAIVEIIGLTKEDAKATFCFEQKQMSRFVTSDPSERMKMISGWFRLEPLERCEARVRAMATSLEDEAKAIDGYHQALDRNEADILKKDAEGKPIWTREKIEAGIPALAKDLERRLGMVATLEGDLQKNAVLIAGRARIDDYEQVLVEGKRVASDETLKKLPELVKRWEKADAEAKIVSVEVGALVRDENDKAALNKGEFTGLCPVAGIQCPAKDSINADRAGARTLYDGACAKAAEGRRRLDELARAEQLARSELQAAQRIDQRLEALREQAKRLAPAAKAAKAAGTPEDPTSLRMRLDKERGDATEARVDLERVRGWLVELDKIATTRATLGDKRGSIEKSLGVYREAAVIFGKRGAQRRVAEGALGQIETEANDALKACGVQLEVEVRWSREGKGLASACDACGNPFPASTKVKNCERCGVARGPKLENKLEIGLSDRSGAAEDLAGANVQLAASRWLREDRGTAWSTALLDEPFGALDASHRKAFASHLVTMLGHSGFDQAFVVAHHASVLDALPGRILITSDGKWSKVEVVA
jgi:DNA repair exonuclease SbcCD ATPase subunit